MNHSRPSIRHNHFSSWKRLFAAILLISAFQASLHGQAMPADAIARFHINEANYDADVGRYLEAVEDLNTAFEFAEAAAIKAEALSLKATLFSTFLDNPQAAIQEYGNILQNFAATPFYEPAVFQAAMLRYQTGDLSGARTGLARYAREFPSGPRAATAEFLLGRLDAGQKAPPPEPAPSSGKLIRIALEEADAVDLSSAQPMTLVDGETRRTIGTRARLTSEQTGRGAVKVISHSPIRANNRTYRGAIVLIPESGGLRIVNEIAIEEYLYSVVASEVPPSWHIESLKAQAVAARTYAYYHVMHPRSPGKFDVYDDVRSQVYGGYLKESARVRDAVDQTRGQVLTYGGHVVLAYFTSNNGGTSADPSAVFGIPFAYLKSNADDYSTAQPLGKWSRRFSIASVTEALKRSGYDITEIRGITPLKIDSGRIIELGVDHAKGRLKLNTRSQFRRAINQYVRPRQEPENLPEILVNINISGTDIVMSGGGWGHGVGMSQFGAKGMAEKGVPYRNILSAYYLGADLVKIY